MSAISAKIPRRTRLAVSAIVLLALGASGCTRLRTHQGYVGDPVLVDSIAEGVDNRQSVQTSLGRPTFVGQFDNNDWYYFARDSKQLAFSEPKASAQTVLHIRFDPAGNVVAVNKFGMEYIANINPVGDRTPTLGRNRSFFEDLFGGIGTVGAPGTGGGGGGGGPGR